MGRVAAIAVVVLISVMLKLQPLTSDVASAWDKREPEVVLAQGIIEGTALNTVPYLEERYNEFRNYIEKSKPNSPSVRLEKDLDLLIKLSVRLRIFGLGITDLKKQLELVTPHVQNANTLEDRVRLAKPEDYSKKSADPQIVKLEQLRLQASRRLFCLNNTLLYPDYDCSQL